MTAMNTTAERIAENTDSRTDSRTAGQDGGIVSPEHSSTTSPAYSGQSKKQQKSLANAKRKAENKKNRLENAKLATRTTMASIQASAKSLAKVLADEAVDTRAQYWTRVDAIEAALNPLRHEAERKALFSLTQAQMALEGKTAIKNQDLRHWTCAADARKSYPELNLEQYGENKLERTILKWLKGSFTDVLKHGINCFTPTDKADVKLPDGTTASGSEIFANLGDFVALYAADTQRKKTSKEERATKSGERIATFLNKELTRENSLIVTVLGAMMTTLSPEMKSRLADELASAGV